VRLQSARHHLGVDGDSDYLQLVSWVSGLHNTLAYHIITAFFLGISKPANTIKLTVWSLTGQLPSSSSLDNPHREQTVEET